MWFAGSVRLLLQWNSRGVESVFVQQVYCQIDVSMWKILVGIVCFRTYSSN